MSEYDEYIKDLEKQCNRQRRRIAELKAFIQSFVRDFEAVLREDEDESG